GARKAAVFAHLDCSVGPLPTFYEERPKIAEAYDRGVFHAYHTAEHHATPLGLAASPSVFLAAVAQRTPRLPLRSAGLYASAPPSAAGGGGDLHARPAQRSTLRARGRPRHLADRDRRLRGQTR